MDKVYKFVEGFGHYVKLESCHCKLDPAWIDTDNRMGQGGIYDTSRAAHLSQLSLYGEIMRNPLTKDQSQ